LSYQGTDNQATDAGTDRCKYKANAHFSYKSDGGIIVPLPQKEARGKCKL